MRKLFGFILVGIITLIVIVFVGAPLIMGFWIKNNYQRILNTMNKASGITLKIVTFERGWFTSKATLQATIKTPWLQRPQRDAAIATHNNPLKFTVQQQIKNGPWSIVGAHKFFWAAALLQSTSNNPNITFSARTLIHFNNAVDNTFRAESITIASDQQKLAIKNLTVNSQLQFIKSLWYGKRSITIDKITYHNSKNQPLIITHVIWNAHDSQTNGTSAGTTTIHANSVTGAGINLQPIDLKFSITDINTQALVNFINAGLLLKQPTHLKPSRQQLKTLLSFVTEVVNKGFTATLHHLKVGTTEGLINATAQLTFPKQANTTSMLLLSENANGELHIQMPMAWLQQQLASLYQGKDVKIDGATLSPATIAKQQIQQWLHNKKLIQEGQNVKISITFEHGKLLINGLPPSYRAPLQIPMQPPSVE